MKNFKDVLCNQVIDIALVVKEVEETPSSISPAAYANVDKFLKRINLVLGFAYTLFVNYNNGLTSEEEVIDNMNLLMYTLTNYKNSYVKGRLANITMNSLLDIVTESFVELKSN